MPMPDSTPIIRDLVTYYLQEFPDESARLKSLLSLIEHAGPEHGALTDRRNFVGHVTASALVVNPDTRRVLQIFHHRLHRYLQPGGHLEPTDTTPLAAARREVAEETGLAELTYLPYHFNPDVPIDIDYHPIPSNESNGEPAHYHHDFRYVFLARAPEDVRSAHGPPPPQQWSDLADLRASVTFLSLTQKIERLLSRELRQRQYYDRIASGLCPVTQGSCIVVTHILPDALEYLNSLRTLSSVRTVIPKPKSIVDPVLRKVESRFLVSHLSRHQVQDPNTLVPFLANHTDPFVLFDIGGWFAPVVNDLAERYPDRFRGVIEDTENGHRKYERLDRLAVPVISVGRSPLKDNEDFLVGQSVLFSADAILREMGHLIQYLHCGVIGFGKIGRSIAQHLLLRGVKPSVYDCNPVRRVAAYNLLCNVPDLEELLQTSDVVFSATGGQALDIQEFRKLKAGSFVFSVTSSDDEFDLRHLEAEYTHVSVAPHVKRYSSARNVFHLVNDGNAVNFIHKAVLGEFINLVRAEMLFAYKRLLTDKLAPGLHEMDVSARRVVAEEWLNTIIRGP